MPANGRRDLIRRIKVKGNKQEVLAFIGNVDTTFAVINPEQEAIIIQVCINAY